MPDLYTHTALAYAVPDKWRAGIPLEAFLAGAALPDVLAYVPLKLLVALRWFVPVPNWLVHVFVPWHSPAVFALACFLLSFLFEQEKRKKIFLGLLGGSLFHLFIDLFQYQPDGGYFVFYPFSLRTFQLGLIHADFWAVWAGGATILVLIKLFFMYSGTKQERNPDDSRQRL
jgi:hypothetical protein